jgi:hypothetical protein
LNTFEYNAGLTQIAGGILFLPFLGTTIFGWLPMLAGLAMAMSSVTVAGNSILLGRYKPRFANKKSKKGKSRRRRKRDSNILQQRPKTSIHSNNY